MSETLDEDQRTEALKLYDSTLAIQKRYYASEKGQAKIKRYGAKRRELSAKIREGQLDPEKEEDRLLLEKAQRARDLARERGRRHRLSEKGRAREARAYAQRKALLQEARAIRKAQAQGKDTAASSTHHPQIQHDKDDPQQAGPSGRGSSNS